MPRAKYVVLELLINKLNEFLGERFGKKTRSSDKIDKLDKTLKKQFDLSVLEISDNAIETVRLKLDSANLNLLEHIISLLFEISTSKDDHSTVQGIKANSNLNKRILELILFFENKEQKLSLELRNIKNSMQLILNERHQNKTTLHKK